jgi:hypothetical protein
MKLTTKILPVLLMMIGIGIFTSCKKLIEVPPNPSDRIATSQAFSDSANVMNVMSGLYTQFSIMDNGSSASFMDGGVTIYPGMSADELINHNVSLLPFHTPYYTNSLLATDPYTQGMWERAYQLNFFISQIIKNVEGKDAFSTSFRNQIVGEVLVVRAFIYFNLVNMFGGVPIVTSVNFKETATLPRETTDNVYEFIIADL